jgi:integrase
MISELTQNGVKIATAHDLVGRLKGNVSETLLSSFRTTIIRLSDYLQVTPDQLRIETLIDVTPGFKDFLEQRHYKRGSVESYCKFARLLLAKAEQVGWRPLEADANGRWQEILAAVKPFGCQDIVRYAIRHGIDTLRFTDLDLEAWGETLMARGRTYCTARETKTLFKRVLKEHGLGQKLPLLSPNQSTAAYAVPIERFPAQLKEEVEALLKWKQAVFAPGRPRRARQRPVTAESLRSYIQQMYGFATQIQPLAANDCSTAREGFVSLIELITRERVTSFISWLLNERKVLNGTVAGNLWQLYAAVRYYPPFKSHDFSWLSEFARQLPCDPSSGIEERKLAKYLLYDDLAEIPRKIHKDRERLPAEQRKRRALLARDELLIRWLTTLPWRQRNIRECRIPANLFKAAVPPLGSIELPSWVQDRIRVNPNEEFWQFDFREHETKNGERVRAIVPRQLVPMLEEYLAQHRPALLNGHDPGTLFVTRGGKALDGAHVENLIADITVRYAGRRTTPHLFRDSFAYKWLQDHPTDYLTLSKHLWHKDLHTTLGHYGSKFDTSRAACSVEKWLDSRELAH